MFSLFSTKSEEMRKILKVNRNRFSKKKRIFHKKQTKQSEIAINENSESPAEKFSTCLHCFLLESPKKCCLVPQNL